MKIKEWNRRTPLDFKGVRLLGAALYLRSHKLHDWTQKQLLEQQEAEKDLANFNELEFPHGVDHWQNECGRGRRTLDELEWRLQVLGASQTDYEKGKSMRAMDFQFRWDLLINHKFLMAYLSDDQPDWAIGWDRETPISERWGDDPAEALQSIFFKEFERVTGPEPEFLPYLREPEEFEFHLAAWKLCEPERGIGQPKGRRWPDGLNNAASYTYSIRRKTMEKGSPITIEKAIERALEEYTIIGSEEFECFPNKTSAIVSDAASEGGRLEGAKKAIRKLLSKWEKEEKDFW
ncbi:hypothetical protein [Roseovarius sp. EL26]|uniref:hypothetical protein n=1 Tax=Roseovarius sp. EL26 TaxID=2126672 RepID=UPI000EA024D0|nr:hypothetical protein [Roseovarius sp. EL26]